MQNEIVGDLQQEMGTELPEGAAEFPLKDLADAFPQYTTMGKFSQQQLSRLVGSRLPGGFGISALKDYLTGERMLGQGRLQAVLLRAMVETPKKRLGNEQEAQAWIDGVVDRYGAEEGVQVPRASAGGGSGGGGGFNPAMLAMLAAGVAALENPPICRRRCSRYSKTVKTRHNTS